MHYFRSHHHLSLPFLGHNRDFFWLFLSKVTRSLAEATGFFFLPIFIFKQATNLRQGLIMVALFYMSWGLVKVLAIFPSAKYIQKTGLRNAMILGTGCYVFGFLFLYSLRYSPLSWFFSLISFGIATPLYWISYLTFFSRKMKLAYSGREVGGVQFFSKLLNALLPLLGGGLYAVQGFESVILLSLIFLIASSFILLQTSNPKVKDVVSLSELRSWVQESKFRKVLVAFSGKNLADSVMVLWPLYLLLLVGSVEKVGYFYSVVLIIALILTYFTGWYLDHRKSKRPFYFSGMVRSLAFMFRAFVFQIWSLIMVDVLEQLASSIYVPFFDTLFLRRSRGKQALSFYAYRELVISASSVIIWLGILCIFLFFNNWIVMFMIASIGMLFSLLLEEKADAKQ